MAPLSAILGPAWLAATLLSSSTSAASAAAIPLKPTDAAARRHAFGIFNAVHSAMRQWGSSLNHNGVSLFLATVPEGQLFYHGGTETGRPEGFEWLAFELEHAQMFGMSRPDRSGDGDGDGRWPPEDKGPETAAAADLGVWESHVWDRHRVGQLQKRSFDSETQKAIGAGPDDDNDDKPGRGGQPDFWRPGRGYFHTYRANRPLNLLYLDGMAAGKSPFGCLDTQDLLLLDTEDGEDRDPNPHNGSWWRGPGSEMARAQGLCDLAKDWAWEGGQIDGFVRTEAGFEIIYCDFSEGGGGGLDLVSVQASPYANETGGLSVFSHFEFLRGVSQRYHGQPAGRIHVDWSSMVSAFFYDVNLTNPDASRPELPRLAQVTRSERRRIRARVHEVAAARHVGPGRAHKDKAVVDWQGIVDTVVTRFAGRFSQLANDTSVPVAQAAREILPILLYPYMNHSNPTEAAAVRLDRCTNHFLAGALATEASWTPEDRSIYVAVTEVTRTICTSLFDMRAVIYDEAANKSVDGDDETPTSTDSRVRAILDELMNTLQWTTWRQCSPCLNPDELCLIAMFPWGSPDDHFNPRCKNKSETNLGMRNNYWMMGW